ncbi:MAG: hypothetical protein WC867_03260 [Candidatus Pacearchaeota archaeon]|jgi:hypothetical protein
MIKCITSKPLDEIDYDDLVREAIKSGKNKASLFSIEDYSNIAQANFKRASEYESVANDFNNNPIRNTFLIDSYTAAAIYFDKAGYLALSQDMPEKAEEYFSLASLSYKRLANQVRDDKFLSKSLDKDMVDATKKSLECLIERVKRDKRPELLSLV